MATSPKKNVAEDFAWAVKTGDLDSVKDFVEKQKMDVNMVENSIAKRTPLHWAADFNQVTTIQYLVSKGAKVNAKDNFGNTPLMAAAVEGKLEAVQALLQNKADPSIKGPGGQTAKDLADKDAIKKLFK